MNASAPTHYLLDTNFLLRRVEKANVHHSVAVAALAELSKTGAMIYLAPQCLYEFWAVATRPAQVNSLGFSPEQAHALLNVLKNSFILLPGTATIFPQWERLVTTYRVQGKPSHDARLVAFMLAHGITHLLTFNDSDFRRYVGEGITIADPAQVPTSSAS